MIFGTSCAHPARTAVRNREPTAAMAHRRRLPGAGGARFHGHPVRPLYVRNMSLQNYVDGITHRVENYGKSDDVLRGWVLDKAHELNLPVTEDNVHILRSGGAVRIDVAYMVTVHAPLYTVNLHFYPGAGSR